MRHKTQMPYVSSCLDSDLKNQQEKKQQQLLHDVEELLSILWRVMMMRWLHRKLKGGVGFIS